jgi:VWFA-related protein
MIRPTLLLLILLAGLSPATQADDPPVDPLSDDGVRVTVRGTNEQQFPTITVDFEVHRPDGSALPNAVREDFEVRESGQPVEILGFEAPQSIVTRPTRVVLVVDTSGSMMEEEDRMTPMKQAVSSFITHLPPGSEVAVVAFSNAVRVIQPFTSDAAAVTESVERLEANGTTRFYDAVARALELLSDQPGRRAVLALTDGMDTGSRLEDLKSVVQTARTAGIPVHTLGVGTEEAIAVDDLQALAEATRGRYFPAREASGLRAIYEEVARSLRESYALTYRSARKLPDGTLRPVEVVYRRQPSSAGKAEVFIRGMVVPAAGWDRLFLCLILLLGALALAPTVWRARAIRGGPA